jgi:hypothetical protein
VTKVRRRVLIIIAIVFVVGLFATRNNGGAEPAAPAPQGGRPTPTAQVGVAATQSAPASAAPAAASSPAPPAATGPAYNSKYEWPLVAYNAANLWRFSQGAGVTIAILGTGIDASHQDLKGVVGMATTVLGKSPKKSGSSLDTEIAGLIAGQGSATNPAVVVGLAPEAKLIDIQVATDPANVSADNIVAGINTAVADGADIIDIPLGIPSDPGNELQAAVTNVGKHHLVIASAASNGSALYPAADIGALSVAAAGPDLHPTGSLIRGGLNIYPPNAVYAPGTGLYSAVNAGDYQPNLSGNPIATAYVAAAAALLRAAHVSASTIKTSLHTDVLNASKGSLYLGVLDPSQAIGKNRIRPGAGVTTPATTPGSSASASTQSSAVTQSASASAPVTASPSHRPVASPRFWRSAWSWFFLVIVALLASLALLAWITGRNKDKDPPDGPGWRRARDWSLEAR